MQETSKAVRKSQKVDEEVNFFIKEIETEGL